MEQRNSSSKMGVMPEGKLLFSMSIPLCISMLVQALYNVVDSIFVSRISENALTAVSLAYPIQMLIVAVSVGTGVGFNSLISRKLGERRVDEAITAATNGLFLMLLSGIVFMLFGIFGSKAAFDLFTDDPEIRRLGTTYLSICCTYSLGVFFQVGCERVLQSQGQNTAAMAMQLIGAVFNIIFDPILIFGLFGFPEMGIAGAAWATVGGQFLSMICCFTVLYRGKFEVKPRLKGFRPEGRVIAEIYRVGVPSIIMQAIGTVMNLMMNALLIGYTTTAVAVFGTFFKVQSIVTMPLFGMTNASMSIMAFNYGAKKRSRLLRTWRLTLSTALALMVVGVTVFHLIPDKILTLFDASEEMLKIGVPALRIMSIGWLFAAGGITNSTLFQALGRGVYSMIVSLIRELVVLVPVAYLFSSLFGTLYAIWWCLPISSFISLVISFIFFSKTYRQQILTLGE